jgi:hypothetical protein
VRHLSGKSGDYVQQEPVSKKEISSLSLFFSSAWCDFKVLSDILVDNDAENGIKIPWWEVRQLVGASY